MLKAPQNLFATAYDGSVRSEWQAVASVGRVVVLFHSLNSVCVSAVWSPIF